MDNYVLLQLVEQLSEGLYVTDLDGRIQYANPALALLLGYTNPRELEGKFFFSFIHEEKREEIKQIYRSRMQSGEPSISLEVPIKTLLGENKLFQIRPSILFGESGAMGSQGIISDITEQRKNTEALRESEERYKNLFNHLAESLAYFQMVYDENGFPIDYITLDGNPTFFKNSPIPKNLVIGKRMSEFVPDIQRLEPNLIQIFGEVATTGKDTHLEFFFPPTQRWYSTYAYSPKKGYFATLYLDITESKISQQKLEQSYIEVSQKNIELTEAQKQIKQLKGILPICSYCNKIRNRHEQWETIEQYISTRLDTKFSHGICPECSREHFGDLGFE